MIYDSREVRLTTVVTRVRHIDRLESNKLPIESSASVLAHHLGALCDRVQLLPGTDVRAFVDIDSLLRPVYGHAKQGASYGHTKICGKQILRKGLSPLVTTISTEAGAPVIAGARLRAGRANSAKGAARMIAQAVTTARMAGVSG